MFTLLMFIAVIAAILLIIMVLLQSSKGGGLAGTFGGAQMGSMFGTRRTADFLSKATWWLGGIVVIIAVLANLFFLPGASSKDSVIQKGGRGSIPTQPSLPQQTQQK